MRAKLTKRAIEAVKPAEKDIWLYDTELKGLGLKVTPTGSRVYFVQYWHGRRRRRYTIGRHGPITVDQARVEAVRVLGQVAMGEDPTALKRAGREALTVVELANRYMEEYATIRKKPLSIAADERSLRLVIIPAIGHLRVPDVTRMDVTKLHQSFKGEPIKANRALALLSKMFNLAETWGLRPDASNPCRHVEKYREKKRERYLSGDELAHLGQTLAQVEADGFELPSVATAIRLLILTGARLSEILTLKWEHVDPEFGALRLPDSKTGSKTIPLNLPAVEVLEKTQRLEGNPYVCTGIKHGSHLVGIQRPWQRIRKRAGLEDVRLHDLRHSYASMGAAAGMGLPVIGALLGHTQASTTQRYAHLANDPLKAATEEIGRRITEAMSQKPKRGKVIPLKRK